MADSSGIQSVNVPTQSVYGGGSVGLLGKRKKSSGSSSSSGGNTDDPGAPSYHRGGKVRKTGLARLKKGERVLTKGQQKRLMRGRGKSR